MPAVRFSSDRNSMISALVLVSRLPVGSSARSAGIRSRVHGRWPRAAAGPPKAGGAGDARAPPGPREPGLCGTLPSFVPGNPLVEHRELDVFKGRCPGSRLNPWKTNPLCRLRITASSSRPRRLTSCPSRVYVPSVGVSRHPRMFMSVDLPEPDGPMTAPNSPGSIEREDPAQGFHRDLPQEVGLADAGKGDERHG